MIQFITDLITTFVWNLKEGYGLNITTTHYADFDKFVDFVIFRHNVEQAVCYTVYILVVIMIGYLVYKLTEKDN